jgi:YggT family protein
MNVLIFSAIIWLLRIMQYIILARVIISWLPIPKENQFIRLLYQITEPILSPIRNIIGRSSFGKNSMIDFSPILAFILIGLLQNILARVLL